MLILIGGFIVLASTLGGFMLAGGQPLVLLHVSEFVVILGVAAGVLVIASPGHVLKHIIPNKYLKRILSQISRNALKHVMKKKIRSQRKKMHILKRKLNLALN